ncbi:bile acid:sodium symporter family protein [Arsenophonus sp.]|uniref:bile acid:sodium symporter family protein n=1 Tax=Arsenophonus sp. TaxID=1872640 RepID=UPI003879B213
MCWWSRLQTDYFLLFMLMTIMLASFFPCQGKVKIVFQHLTTIAIALLFFLHGAKLSRQAIFAGIGHWRLHLLIFCSTFILFPIIGLALKPLVPEWMSPTVYIGFLYLCALPATVQSAIAFTSVAGGNIAAAICSASASSLLGVFLSPILVSFLIDIDNHQQIELLSNIGAILLQIMLPFILGHLLRPLLVQWINRYRKLITISDDLSSILLVVYVAFSEAVIEGIWYKVDGWSLLMIAIVSGFLLAIVILFNIYTARYFGFSKADEITIVFCGSKKSLVNGVPMANILFPAHLVGIILLPVMIFHQIQLMVCALLAQRYAKKSR